jgi:FixJ family two-component response regulator
LDYHTSSNTPSRILLVEDDDAVRRSLQLLLSSQGYDVRAYSSAVGLSNDPEALRSACLVADLMMPEKDAIDLLTRLKEAGWTGPAILISGYLTAEREKAARHAGFDEVLAKPFSDSSLVRTVRGLIDRSSSGAAEITAPAG